jgi:hypothetical protein
MSRRRFPSSIGAVAVVTAAVLQVPVAGQAPASATKTTTVASIAVPRTEWGQPDLRGIWNFGSATPLQRPDALADKDFLTDEEAAAVEEQTAKTRSDESRASSCGGVGNYNSFWYDQGGKVVGSKRTSLVVDPPDGRIPRLTPEVQKRQAAEREARNGVSNDAPTPGGWLEELGPAGLRVRCVFGNNSGPPMTPGPYNNNVQLFQTPGYVVILNEQIHNARIVPLDGRPHLGQHMRQWSGDSRGHWEGDTLVVDTTNFLRETVFTFYGSSANMHLVERFTRVDAETLTYEYTVTDPTTWTRPWTVQFPMTKTKGPLYEYACHEGNYGLVAILSGARAQEKAAEEAANKKGLK